MAVKKKTVAKKAVAKKAVVKKTAAKKTAKKAVAKKAVAKKAVAKKAVAKKAVAKKAVAKKAVAKKAVAKKAAPKKSTAKKTTVKRVAKKASVRSTGISNTRIEFAPPLVAPVVTKPAPTPSQNASGRVVFLVLAGIVILGAIVWSKSAGMSSEDESPTPAASISQSAEPTESATAEPTESATAEPTESATAEPTESAVAVTGDRAPRKFVAIKNADGLSLRWVEPTSAADLTGYNVEIRSNGAGDWSTIATVPTNQFSQEVTKVSDSGWTQFRVSSVYDNGDIVAATIFGIPGEFQ